MQFQDLIPAGLKTTMRVGFCLVFISLLAACVSDRERELQERNVLFPESSSASSSQNSDGEMTREKHPCSRKDFLPSPEEAWHTSWNYEDPTTTVTLTSGEKDFTVALPYNPGWGNYECVLSPYDENDKDVLFGFAGIFEGGGATRFNRIDLIPARDEKAAVASANRMLKEDQPAGGVAPAVITVNGNTVVKYGRSGFCGWTYYEVLGKKWNYVFNSTCDADVPGIEAALESLQIH